MVGTFIIGLSYSFESVLAGCVPNLHLYLLIFNFNGFDFKVHPYAFNKNLDNKICFQIQDYKG